MKARALKVKECAWTTQECHLLDDMNVATERESLCLPNLFKSKKVKPFNRARTGPTYQVHYTARELFLELLDRGAIQELAKRAGSVGARARRPSYSQSREQSAELSEEQYAEALTCFSIILQSGLSSGRDCSLGSDPALYLDRWQGVLKRSSFQTSILSLSQLEDGDNMEALSAFYSHLTKRCQALYTPGQHLVVKKYRLSYRQAPCPLHLALLCDLNSGFICNMYLYCPEQLQRCSRTPVVEQVVGQLLRPYYNRGHLVQLDNSAWMEGRLAEHFCDWGINIHFVPSVERPVTEEAPSASPPATPRQHQWAPGTQEDPPSQLVTHLQGWTGPALFPVSDPRGPAADAFVPGIWATLHMICINTFVLHTLQSEGLGGQIGLREFTRSLGSQLAVDNCVAVPILSEPHTSSYEETYITSLSEQRTQSDSCGPAVKTREKGCSSAWKLQGCRLPGVCGLGNSGNSCYLNAVLQCLCSTVPLVEYFLDRGTRNELARHKCVVAEVLVGLLEEMWLGRNSSLSPVEVRSMLCSLHPQFNNNSQQDAQELLLFLLNALNDDLKKAGSSTRKSRRDQNRNSPNPVGGSTIISRLFEGQLSYATVCTYCGHQAHNTQVFTMLSLPIPADTFKCSLEDCLSLFFQQSTLTSGDQMLCSECGVRRDTTVLTSLDKPPDILMLHLKRFGCQGRKKVKLRTNVLFSLEKLDLAPFLSGPSADQTTYSLYAVVNHTGHLDMGHYTALCLNAPTRSWHCFDDSMIREVQDYLVQSPDAYMLLYSHKPFQQPKIHRL